MKNGGAQWSLVLTYHVDQQCCSGGNCPETTQDLKTIPMTLLFTIISMSKLVANEPTNEETDACSQPLCIYTQIWIPQQPTYV